MFYKLCMHITDITTSIGIHRYNTYTYICKCVRCTVCSIMQLKSNGLSKTLHQKTPFQDESLKRFHDDND